MPVDLNYAVSITAPDGTTSSRILDIIQTLAQFSVISRSITTPPASPNDNDVYIVPAGATGVWTGYTNQIAIRRNGGWMMITPVIGWLVWVQDEGLLYSYSGTTWVLGGVPSGGTAGQILAVSGSTMAWTDTAFPPIGSILSWAKSFAGTPALPGQWVECNGQVLSDVASVYNGATIPNLNGSGGGTKRFLRGSTTSGTTSGADTFTPVGTVGAPSGTFSATGGGTAVASTAHTHTFTGTNAASLPSYYEVVMIMRVK